ncbi:MAG: phage antirepressor protein [Deltaproteobacteria bacterium RIFOXYD12_FULL_55_16]|nr:MAG: phage antirepressor protein [Deltaproteobacteria bacterium RIFOXYD12_FULL_55_16]
MTQESQSDKVALFEGKRIRKVLYGGEWWFSLIDIIEALTESSIPKRYWSDLKKKLAGEGATETYEKIVRLKMPAPDGKMRLTDCADTETMFRVIQSIPSPKVEPLKRWLARVGKERIDEIENPELSMERMQLLYEKKGYPKEWIDKRMRGIAVRQDLTGEWQNRGARTSLEYAILTNEIMQGAFALQVDEYKQVKGLERENLRDHMTDIEMILTMLAEATTTKLHRDRDSHGFEPLQKDAREGGNVAGRTRRDIEKRSGKAVVTSENYKELAGKGQKKKLRE